MRLIGLMPCRNEDWILGLSARAALQWVDEIVILLHACTDNSAAIAGELATAYGERVTVVNVLDAGWEEMNHRQMLLEMARRRGATHMAIIDCDEVLTGNLLGSVRDQAAQMQPGAIVQIPMRNMYGSINEYRSDHSIWGNTVTSLIFGDRADLNWRPAGGYQHHHREPYNGNIALRIYPQQLEGGVMHLQFASRRRLLAKHALYKMDEVIRFPGMRPVSECDHVYSMAPNWEGARLLPAPEGWWEPYREFLPFLNLEAEPWQERQCQRLLAQYGPEKFAGLNLFGVLEPSAVT